MSNLIKISDEFYINKDTILCITRTDENIYDIITTMLHVTYRITHEKDNIVFHNDIKYSYEKDIKLSENEYHRILRELGIDNNKE